MKVLLADTVHPELPQGLQSLGFTVEEDYQSSAQELAPKMDRYTGLIIRSRFPVDLDFIQNCTRLQFIGRIGAGMENIDLEAARSRGIAVLNAPEGNRNAVGEHALGMLLMLMNNLRIADAEVRSGIWKREANRGYELEGKTVGIIGYGQMGSSFAEKLRGFDVRILAYDKYHQGFENEQVKECSLEQLQREADVISFHVPQTPETIHYFDDDFLDRLLRPVYLINTARGKVVRTSTVVKGLKEEKIRGACLDVLEYEKSSFEEFFTGDMPPDLQYLLASDKVILSPHIAGWSYESNEKMARTIVNKVAALNLW